MTQKEGEKKKATLKGEELDKEIKRLIEEEELSNYQITKRLGIAAITVTRKKKAMGMIEVKDGSDVKKWLEDHPEIKRVFSSLKESGRRNYAISFKKYCEWTGKEPTELWKEPWEVSRDRIVDYKMYLEERGKSANTAQAYTCAIRRFYEYNNIIFKGKFLGNGRTAQPKEENDKELIMPTKLREILNISTPFEKVMYLTQYQSGLAAHELCNLKIKDVGEIVDGKVKLRVENGLIKLKLRREKTGVKFTTFIGHDAIESLKQWIDFRQRGKLIKDKELSKEGIIINNNDFLFIGYSRKYRKWSPIHPTTYAGHLRERVRQLGWIGDENLRDKGQLNVFRPHALRMSFSEILKHKANVSWDFVEVMLGHKFSSTDSAYVKFDDNDLMKAYKQAEPLLSLTPIEPIITDDQYTELKMKNELLEEKITALEERDKEISKVNERFEKVLEDKEVQVLLMKKIKEMMEEK